MINIGSLIYKNIGDLVEDRCYPLVADQSTNYPFIIYRSTSTAPNTSKDGIYEWEHSVEITVCDDEYDNCCAILESVVYRLLGMTGVDNVEIDAVNEEFIDDAYVKILNVRIYTE